MTSHTPHGWQNLSPERHRTLDREQILFAIQAVHESAHETAIGDDHLAYWLGEGEDRDLVGFAWKTEHVWFFAYMNRIALDVGVHCTLDTTGRKVRILPTVKHQKMDRLSEPADEYPPQPIRPTNDENWDDAPPAKPKRQRNAVISRRVFRQDGLWYATVETKTHVRELGPFTSREAAASA